MSVVTNVRAERLVAYIDIYFNHITDFQPDYKTVRGLITELNQRPDANDPEVFKAIQMCYGQLDRFQTTAAD